MGVQDVINEVQKAMRAVTGIRAAPDYATDSINVLTVITYASSGGAITGDFGIAETRHNIISEIHKPRTDLANDLKTLMPYVDSVPEALTADPRLNNTCNAFDRISYQIIPVDYNGVLTLCLRFNIENVLIYPYGIKE